MSWLRGWRDTSFLAPIAAVDPIVGGVPFVASAIQSVTGGGGSDSDSGGETPQGAGYSNGDPFAAPEGFTGNGPSDNMTADDIGGDPVDFATTAAEGQAAALTQMGDATGLARAEGQRNLAMAPSISQEALNLARSSSSALDTYLSQRYFNNLSALDPNWKQNIFGTSQASIADLNQIAQGYAQTGTALTNAMGRDASSMLAGNVPSDVSASLRQQTSEASMKGGLGGASDAGRALTAQDLGLTSTQLMQQGATMAGQTANQAAMGLNIASAPMNAAASYANLLKGMTPPVTDVAAMYGSLQSQLTSQATVSPSSILSSSTGLMANNLNAAVGVAQGNSQLAMSQSVSAMNYNADIYGMQLQNQASNALASSQERSGLYTGLGALFGAGGSSLFSGTSSLLSSLFGGSGAAADASGAGTSASAGWAMSTVPEVSTLATVVPESVIAAAALA